MNDNRKLRIAIDCRTPDPNSGTGNAVISLAKALSDSKVTNQEYTFIVREDMQGWLAPYIYGPCKLFGVPVSVSSSLFSKAKTAFRKIPPLRFIWKKLPTASRQIPISDGFVESQGFDLVHFPTQLAYLTKLPTIYQPWDLQHLHYPEFFSKSQTLQREKQYRAFCNQASYVCVQAEWTKQDLINQYQLSEDKVAVIPWGSVLDAYKSPSAEEIRVAVEKYAFPKHFFFYPAATWPHKNHEVIFRALHILKSEQGVTPHVFFTGSSYGHKPTLDKLANNLGISGQLHFLGYVTPIELQVIFKTATAMIFPSKFEGFGLPILEAFHAQLPVLSSNATTLPEVAQNGALYFNPDAPKDLANLMGAVLNNPELRHNLTRQGTLVLSQFSIDNTAAGFRALYEKTASLKLRDDRVPQIMVTG